jgi:preprotein translocase subunit SecA
MQMARIEDEAQPVAAGVAAGGGGTALAIKGQAAAIPANVDWKHVGRNEMCPCGSGKKFKSCHYPELRAQGVI